MRHSIVSSSGVRSSSLRKLLIASGTCLLSLSLVSSPASAQKPKPKAPTAKPAGKPAGKPGGKPGWQRVDRARRAGRAGGAVSRRRPTPGPRPSPVR